MAHMSVVAHPLELFSESVAVFTMFMLQSRVVFLCLAQTLG